MPAAGHMVHMPGHIYQRVGRYADAIRANELAILADEDYITQCGRRGCTQWVLPAQRALPLVVRHDGRPRLDGHRGPRKVAAKIPDAMLTEMPMLAGFRIVPLFALARFGRWDDVLQEPAPPAGAPSTKASGTTRGASRSSARGRCSRRKASWSLSARRSRVPISTCRCSRRTRMRAVLAIAPRCSPERSPRRVETTGRRRPPRARRAAR